MLDDKLLAMGTTSRSHGTSVTAMVSTAHVVVDTNTGEITPLVEMKGKFLFPGGFGFMGVRYITDLRKANLPAQGYQLALLLMEEARYVGFCTKPFKQLAEELGVDAPRISRLLAKLEKVGVAQRVGNRQSGTIMVNPTFWFRGSAAEHKKAVDAWLANRPIGIVSEERKTA